MDDEADKRALAKMERDIRAINGEASGLFRINAKGWATAKQTSDSNAASL